MKSSETSSYSEIYCIFCKAEPSDKIIRFSEKFYTPCDTCLEAMVVLVFSDDLVRWDLAVAIREVSVVLASTFYEHDPIFWYMARCVRDEVNSAKTLLLAT